MVDDAEAAEEEAEAEDEAVGYRIKIKNPIPSSGATVKCGRYNNISQASAVKSSFCMGCVPIGWRPVNGDRAIMVKKESAHTMHAK